MHVVVRRHEAEVPKDFSSGVAPSRPAVSRRVGCGWKNKSREPINRPSLLRSPPAFMVPTNTQVLSKLGVWIFDASGLGPQVRISSLFWQYVNFSTAKGILKALQYAFFQSDAEMPQEANAGSAAGWGNRAAGSPTAGKDFGPGGRERLLVESRCVHYFKGNRGAFLRVLHLLVVWGDDPHLNSSQ